MKTLNNKPIIAVVIAISIITIVAILFYLLQFYSNGLSSKPADWASFGAYIGGVLGTCFAFATFWMLFLTFGLQQRQSFNIEIQKFETTFYSLLTLHNQTLEKLEKSLSSDQLESLIDNDNKIGKIIYKDNNPMSMIEPFQAIEDKNLSNEDYLKELQENILKNVELSQYFRILYQLLKFIASNNPKNPNHVFNLTYLNNIKTLDEKHEKMYSSIVRGFVPVKLLPILALNCIYYPNRSDNYDRYQAMLERYSFLEHIRFDLLPSNLAIFTILNNYNFAFGENKNVINKAIEIKNNYKNKAVNESYYLHQDFIDNVMEAPVIQKESWRKRADDHLEKIGKAFYSDDATAHEAIVFLLSNIGASVFFLTLFFYLLKNYDLFFKEHPWNIEYAIPIAMCFTFLASIYLLVICAGRFAVSLGRKLINDNIAFIVICIFTLLMFGTIYLSILMTI